jgi:thymidylate synthase (FAD)
MGFVLREARLQDQKNRQNSIALDVTDPEQRELQAEWEWKQHSVISAAKAAYTWAVSNGIAKEQARAVLPEGNTESRLYVAGTIRSWIHYIQVRRDVSTQLEHRLLALEAAKAISQIFPVNLE